MRARVADSLRRVEAELRRLRRRGLSNAAKAGEQHAQGLARGSAPSNPATAAARRERRARTLNRDGGRIERWLGRKGPLEVWSPPSFPMS